MAKTNKKSGKQTATNDAKGGKRKHRVRITAGDRGRTGPSDQAMGNGRPIESGNGVRGDVPGRADLLNTIKAVHDNFETLAELMGREQMVRLVLNHLHHSYGLKRYGPKG